MMCHITTHEIMHGMALEALVCTLIAFLSPRSSASQSATLTAERRIASRKIFLFLHFNSHFHPFCFSALNEARPLSHHPQLKRNGCVILRLITTIFREANEGMSLS